MPELFSMEHETLRASADKIRGILSENHYTFDPSIFGENGIIPDGSIILRYAEFIDFDSHDISEYGTLEPVIDFNFLPNNRGEIVPVLYVNDYLRFPENVGYEDKLFYEGTVEINGETCDKWRKIEIDNLGDDLDWDADKQVYYYTNVIILKSNEISPLEFPQKIDEVYETGKTEVYAEVQPINAQLENTLNGTDTGGKSFYDEFWDNYQENGNRTDYIGAFSGTGWTEQTFKPKYDITPTNALMIFRYNTLKVDLVEYLNNLGVKIDFSKSKNTQYIFGNSAFTRIGVVDVSSATNSVPLDGTFTGNIYLVTIDKIVLKTGSAGEFNNGTFNGCSALENVTFEGLITKNGLNMQWSTKLSKASITNIIELLSTTSSGTSITLSKVAVNKAFETSEGADDGTTSSEWTTLIGTRSKWTISLV